MENAYRTDNGEAVGKAEDNSPTSDLGRFHIKEKWVFAHDTIASCPDRAGIAALCDLLGLPRSIAYEE